MNAPLCPRRFGENGDVLLADGACHPEVIQRRRGTRGRCCAGNGNPRHEGATAAVSSPVASIEDVVSGRSIGEPVPDRGDRWRLLQRHRLECLDTPLHFGAARTRNWSDIAEQAPALPGTSAARIASPIRAARRSATSIDGYRLPRSGRKSGRDGRAVERAGTRVPAVPSTPVEEVGRGAEPLGRRQPGVRALGAVARLDQPLPGARIAGLLQVVGDRVRVGVGRSPCSASATRRCQTRRRGGRTPS